MSLMCSPVTLVSSNVTSVVFQTTARRKYLEIKKTLKKLQQALPQPPLRERGLAAQHSLLRLARRDVKGRSGGADAFWENVHPHLELSLKEHGMKRFQETAVRGGTGGQTRRRCGVQPERGWAGRSCKGSGPPRVRGRVPVPVARAGTGAPGPDPSARGLPCGPLEAREVTA